MSIQALYTAATGMNSMQAKLDVIANNLANTETTGFKSDRRQFRGPLLSPGKISWLAGQRGAYTAVGIATGTGSRVQSTQSNFTQGSLRRPATISTWPSRDKASSRSKTPSGTILYTRAGNFSRNSQGADCHGVGQHRAAAGTDHHDSTRRNEVSISTSGVVSYQTSTNTTLQQAGTIQLANFINPQGLLKIGENLYQETEASGTAQTGAPAQTDSARPSKARWNSPMSTR